MKKIEAKEFYQLSPIEPNSKGTGLDLKFYDFFSVFFFYLQWK